MRPEYLIFAAWAFWGPRKTSTLLWVAGAVSVSFSILNEAMRPFPRGFPVLDLVAPFVWAGLAILWHKRKNLTPKEPAKWAQTIPQSEKATFRNIGKDLEKYADVSLWKKFTFGWSTNARLLAMGIPAQSLPVEVRVDVKEQLREAGLSPIEAAVVIASRLPTKSQPHDKIVSCVRDWSNRMDDTHPLVHRALRELGFQMSDESYAKAYERSGNDPEWLIGRDDPIDPLDAASDPGDRGR